MMTKQTFLKLVFAGENLEILGGGQRFKVHQNLVL